MNIGLIILTFLNIVLLAGLSFSLFLRIKEKKEDQRMTKGLQLLQNKISILEDLSDKTDEQVRKLVHLIEQKTIEIKNNITLADEKNLLLNQTVNKMTELHQLSQNRLSDEDLSERKKSTSLVLAAQLAHQGQTAEQIAQQIDLSPAEIEMIIKVNKDQLQFSSSELPQWLKHSIENNLNSDIPKNTENELLSFANAIQIQNQKMNQVISATAFDQMSTDLNAQSNLRKEFDQVTTKVPQTFVENKESVSTKFYSKKEIRPFEFKKI